MSWTDAKDELPENGTYFCLGHNNSPMVCLMRGGQWWRNSGTKRVTGIECYMPVPPRYKLKGIK